MESVPIKISDNPENWYIRFPVGAVEWNFLCLKLRDSVKDNEDAWSFATHQDTGDWVFVFRRDKYSAASISKIFGVSEESLAKTVVLRLKKKESPKEPTVSGWGTA